MDTVSIQNTQELERLTIPKDRIALMLDSTQWANDFDWEQILKLASYFAAYRCRRGTILVKQGEVDQRMMLIVSGQVNILKETSEDNSQVLATLRGGHSLGEMAMVDKEPRSATAVAASGVQLLMITHANIRRLATENPYLAYCFVTKICRMLSQRLRRTSGMLLEFNDSVPEE